MEERIKKALEIARRYGQIDGSHHKMWVIDQLVRTLCGDKEHYEEFVKEYEHSDIEDDYDEYYEWDVGIAP